ncbi:hypothetical protein niasHS_013150 [Heterodera schachtii]|uniref:Transmembrane protein n=1 Tax=Heterodera schachtii TaxID=97005 RepID=A0ABD2IDF6_HETSC
MHFPSVVRWSCATLALSLTDKGKLIDFRGPPFCCLLYCLPRANPTEVNLTRLEWIVLQAPIIRVLIVFGQVVVVAEAREDAYRWLQFFDLATVASLLLAIFGVHTLARVTSEELSRFGFGGIFRLVDFGLFFFTAQQPFLFQNIFLRFGVIHCAALLSPQDNARFICNFCIIAELLLLSMFSIFWASPHRNSMFDQFVRRRPATLSKGNRSRSSSLQSVRESKFDEPPNGNDQLRATGSNGAASISPSTVGTSSTQMTGLLTD